MLKEIYCKKPVLKNVFLVDFGILFQDRKTDFWKFILLLLNDTVF